MTDAEIHVFAEGRVQGVGYRDFVRRMAKRHGVSGWARNRADGRVEVFARGGPDAIEALLANLRRGPPTAAVTGLRVEGPRAPTSEALTDFRILPTA